MTLNASAAWVAEAAARKYLSAEEVIAWVDQRIAEYDDPPFWLLEVSPSKAGVAEMTDLIRPHGPELGFEEKARIAAIAYARGRLTAPEIFDAMTRLWVESMFNEGSSELPDGIATLLIEHDQLLDDGLLPTDFHDRFEAAVRELAEGCDSLPFPPA